MVFATVKKKNKEKPRSKKALNAYKYDQKTTSFKKKLKAEKIQFIAASLLRFIPFTQIKGRR